MRRFFFHIRTSTQFTIDDEGIEFPDVGRAWSEAREGAKDLLREQIAKGRPISNEAYEVTDETGALLFVYRIRNAMRLH